MSLLLLADPSREVVESYIHRGRCFVAQSNGKIIGEYVLLDTRPQTVEIVNVAVVEEEHGKGIGKQLVRHAITTANSMGYKTIEVGTGNSSVGYQKCGFRIIGVDRDFFTVHYDEPIYENGMQCRDMVRLALSL
ncbi:GNAT family N-acetyltransferase [Alicyclobacillus dauci]|uniref:GNAT family N-acetyltransferase n=1 Tax=Alicyclobacillus dauci TaxID=1475485 RepID=A0ABY6Z8C2_9BACL|nr:GNAT family N-acetyltransferase [Alicyclobacillus dauci]WAH39109.1 GNAT family N-acetyltransferase [Alicyclobacillus dauci]